MVYKIGWFSSGRDGAARELLKAVWDSIQSGEVPAEVSLVFCSQEPGESPEGDLFLQQAQGYGIPLVALSFQKFRHARGSPPMLLEDGSLPPWRMEYDREVMRRLAEFSPSLCVMAGYMLIVSDEMCIRYPFLNLHPAAPGGPTGTWQEVIWQLIAGEAKETGVIMHLVTPELDRGPVVTYCTFPIAGGDFEPLWAEARGVQGEELKSRYGEDLPLFKRIRQHGVAREIPLIVATVKAFAEGRVSIKDRLVLDGEGRTVRGYDLTEEIEQRVSP